jgi:subtilisin family serine protease
MKKLSTLIAIILLIPILISQKPPRNGDKPYVDGQIMIKLRSDLPQNQQQMLRNVLADFQSVGLGLEEKLSDRLNIFLLDYNPALVDDQRLLQDIKDHPYVELAQFNHYIQQRALIPDDNFFGLQWNMNNTGQTGGTNDADIDAPEAWDLGNSGVTATGDTIIIAIVDDGFDINHEDISYWKNYLDIPGNGMDDDSNGYVDDYDGWNSWTNTGEIIEKDHGTHVTGIAAAQGNNGMGVTGVNMHVKVMPVVGSATVESIVVAGYAYVLEMRSLYNETGGEKGAFIVSTNASFGVNNGQPEDYPIWGAMYDSLGMRGILSAAATANANWNVDEVGDIPTAFPSNFLITVTNTDNNDVKSSFAAYGPTTIDLGAPGTQIYSTRQANGYGYKTGTSMASPHAAGAIAYMFSVANEEFMTAYHNDPAGMALVIKQYILAGTDPLPSLEGITVTGGRLNIYQAALKMMNPDFTFNPLSILQIMAPEKQDSVALAFTNNSSVPVAYSFNYPDTLDWISLTGPLSGTVNGSETKLVKVHFNTLGLDADTLSTFLIFNYGDGKKFLEPVHLFIDPSVSAGSEHGSMEAWGQGKMAVWPNPARNDVHVRLNMDDVRFYKDLAFIIYDIFGRKIEEINIAGGQNEIQLNVEDFKPGIYMAMLKDGNLVMANGKFVVTK